MQWSRSRVKRIVRRRIPTGVYDAMLSLFGVEDSLVPDLSIRNNVKMVKIDDAAVFHVFWKDLPIGKGATLSLVVHDYEILRFDCLGEDAGHSPHACEQGA